MSLRIASGRDDKGINMPAEVLLTVVAHAVASIVSLHRELVHHMLTDDECEKAEVPYGTTERAVYLLPLEGVSWWHYAVYVKQCGPESCVDVRGLGMCAEVWYLRDHALARS